MSQAFTVTYSLHETHFDKVHKRLAKLASIADKLGMEPFVLQPGEIRLVERQKQPGVMDRFIDLTFSGSKPVISGWRFLAKIEHGDGANIIKGFDADEADKRFRSCPPNCDHCNLPRNRKDTFVLVDDVLGKQIQVGSSCVDDFVGNHFDPKLLLELYNGLGELNIDADIPYSDMDDEDYLGGGASRHGLNPERVLEAACAIIRIRGRYIKVDETDFTTGEVSTKEELDYIFFSGKVRFNDLVNSADVEEARQVRAWIQEPRSGKEDTTYRHNLQAIASSETLDAKRHLGLMASAPAAFHTSQQLAKAKAGRVSTHIGAPDEKLKDREVIFEARPHTEGRFGTKYFVLMTDVETGAALKWETTSPLPMVKGQRYTINATVKDHGEYDGIKQTSVLRVTCPDLKLIESIRFNIDALLDPKEQAKFLKKINNPNTFDNKGRSLLVAFALLSKSDDEVMSPIIRVLLHKGADPLLDTGYDKNLKHVLDIAMVYGGGNLTLARTLLDHLKGAGADMASIKTVMTSPGDEKNNASSFAYGDNPRELVALGEEYGLTIDDAIYEKLELSVPGQSVHEAMEPNPSFDTLLDDNNEWGDEEPSPDTPKQTSMRLG